MSDAIEILRVANELWPIADKKHHALILDSKTGMLQLNFWVDNGSFFVSTENEGDVKGLPDYLRKIHAEWPL